MPRPSFTRQALYDLAWSKPLTKIAETLTIKESLLRKICKQYDIPLPKSGYWMKLKYKKKVRIEKLPRDEKWKDVKIDLEKLNSEHQGGYHQKLATRIKEIKSRFPKETIVPQKLMRPSPLVKAAKTFLAKERPSRWNGFEDVIRTSNGFLSIGVTKKQVPRMLRFIDSFIKLLEKRGHQIEVNQWDSVAIVYDERFNLKFCEKCTHKIIQEGSWTTRVLVPNGILSLKLAHPYEVKEWKDGKKLLEQQLARIIATLELRAENKKKERVKWEKIRAEQKRIQAIRDREEARKQHEHKKKEMLLEHASQWRTAQNLNSFLAHFERDLKGKNTSIQVKEWLNWARLVKDSLNPIGRDMEEYIGAYKFKCNLKD